MFRSTIWLGVVGLSVVAGCASMGFGYDEGALKKQVAFETRCPKEKIGISDAMEAGVGHTKFRVNVCGEEQRWDRYGTSYFPEGKGPMGH